MTFQNIDYGRVIRAVVMMVGAALVLTFVASCFMLPFVTPEMEDRFSNLLELVTSSDSSSSQVDAELQALVDDYGPEINLQYGLQWSFATLATFWAARWAAKRATSPEQATGYGILVGSGAIFSYGVFCVMCSVAFFGLRVLFLGMILLAGYLGGRYAGQRLSPDALRGDLPVYGPGAGRPGFGAGQPKRGDLAPGGPGAETFYNMGVMAALGGRRDEARQHFTRVVQMQPRHLAAWLQLANLADSPEQAWNYVQQARLIDAKDPAVVQAVEIIWPQVAANAARLGPSPNQPPYAGSESNDAGIPRSSLPLPSNIAPPPADRPADGESTPPERG
jgi:hypothetical protein